MGDRDFNNLLNSYLDGATSDVDEMVLFAQLTTNQDFRHQFASALRIRSIAKEVADSIIPSNGLTGSVFAAITVASSNNGTQKQDQRYALATFLPLPLLSGLVLAINVLLALLGPLRHGHQSALVHRQKVAPPSPIELSTSFTNLDEISTSHQGGDMSGVLARRERPATQSSPSGGISAQEPFVRTAKEEDSGERFAPASISRVDYTPNTLDVPVMFASAQTTSIPAREVYLENSTNTGENQQRSLEIGVRHFDLVPTLEAPIAPATGIVPQHTAISLAFLADKNFAVGVEIGQEAFLQQYDRNLDDVVVRVTQYPSLFWAGPFIRFRPLDVLPAGFIPTFSLQGALAQGGVMARGSVGITYSVTSTLSLTLGYETAQLWFVADGTTRRSINNGWTYGLSVQL